MVDFVITWVNDNDEGWLTRRNNATKITAQEADAGPQRIRDWDFLRYWLRSVENCAPWVRKIHLVTPTSVPTWLNSQHPKINVVNGRKLNPWFDGETFNSHAVEANLHLIPGLSEKFVYFNDDMFLGKRLKEEFFFPKGLPHAVSAPFPLSLSDSHSHAMLNTSGAINSKYSKRDLNRILMKRISIPLSKDLWRTLTNLGEKHILPFKDSHLPTPLLKSVFLETSEIFNSEFRDASSQIFRSVNSVAPVRLVVSQLVISGKFSPIASSKLGKYISLAAGQSEISETILSNRLNMFCLNDVGDVFNFEDVKAFVLNTFDTKYPLISDFELY